jgi:glutamyl-tRNA reductase
LSDTLCEIDVVITATSSQEYIINAEMLKNVQEKRGKKPLLVIDISMPLNVEPIQKNNKYMRLMNLDHLSNIVDDNILMRRKKALLIELDAESEVKSFEKWMKELRAIPIIKQLNAYTSVLKTEVALKLEQEIKLSKKERIIITQQISITLNQVLSRSIEVVKDHALEDKEFSWESINNFFQQERKHG